MNVIKIMDAEAYNKKLQNTCLRYNYIAVANSFGICLYTI